MRAEAEGWMPKFGGGHQEVDRIMDELEAIYNSQPTEVRGCDVCAAKASHALTLLTPARRSG